MDGGSFIRDLCIALEHRWEPEGRFVLFTAYFDEADTHGLAPNMTMGAFLGHAREWKLFGRGIKRLQRAENFSVFHATDLASTTGEFRGWDERKIETVIEGIAALVRDTLTEGFMIGLKREIYVKEYLNTFTPKGVSPDSQYGVCFRMLLWQLINNLAATGRKHRLHIVVERGHKNAKNAEWIFDEVKKTLKCRGFDLLGTFTLAAKGESLELMAGDFLAHSYARMRRPGGIGLQRFADAVPQPKKGEAGLSFVEFRPGALQELKLQMQRERLERRAFNRKQKAEAKAASASVLSGDEQPC